MGEYLELGQAPPEEDCAPLGSENYRTNAIRQCRAYIQAIRNFLGPEPDGAELRIKGFEHDYGQYYEVVCHYDPNDQAAVDYAFQCEAKGPLTYAEGGVRAPTLASGRGR